MSNSDVTLTWEKAMRAAWGYVHANELERAAVTGSVLRRKKAVHDVDLLVIPAPGVALPKAEKPLNVCVTTRECWEPALMQYGPAVESVIGTRARAKARGYTLNQYGLWRGGELVSRSAEDICALVEATVSQWVVRSLGGDLVLVPCHRRKARCSLSVSAGGVA